jgi:hypothetical protein
MQYTPIATKRKLVSVHSYAHNLHTARHFMLTRNAICFAQIELRTKKKPVRIRRTKQFARRSLRTEFA